MCHIYWLIIIYHYIPSRIYREQIKAHPWTSCSLFCTKAAKTVPCCTWGHFECGGGALPLCDVNSWPGVPLPFTTLHCCCPLVSTDGMNIFINFANSITLSWIMISLGLALASCWRHTTATLHHHIQNVPTYKEPFLLLLWQKVSNLSTDTPASVP